jgi:hypothetical protein
MNFIQMFFMNLVFISILLIHGLIHLIGFVKEFKIANVNRLPGIVSMQRPKYLSRLIGILWLSAFLSFVMAAVGLMTNNIWWITPAIVGIVISQTLIILHWNDAKWGSIVNAIILVAAIISIAEWNSLRKLSSEVKEIFSEKMQAEQSIITKEKLDGLPAKALTGKPSV